MELLLGSGSSRDKRLGVLGRPEWVDLVTLDIEQRHNPDVVYDMSDIPLPFDDDFFDEIHAYECLEHVGRQGDYKFFFSQFSDFWRMLKNGGLLVATVPDVSSPWAWGDPSHTRVIQPESLIFLNQPAYAQVGKTPMSDFRTIYKADFDIIHQEKSGHSFAFVLKAVKPSRCIL